MRLREGVLSSAVMRRQLLAAGAPGPAGVGEGSGEDDEVYDLT